LISWLVISRAPEKRTLYLGLIVLPFLINSIIRLYALKSFIGFDGPLQGFLKILGIPFDPFAFTGNTYLVGVGMLINYLPFAVLPIYSALHRFDFTLLEAAIDLGCGKMVAFLKVVVPGIRNS